MKLAPGVALALGALGMVALLLVAPLVMYMTALTLVPVVQAEAAAASARAAAAPAVAAASPVSAPQGGQTPGPSAGPVRAGLNLPKPPKHGKAVQIATRQPLFEKTPVGGFDVGGLPYGQCTWYVALQRGIVAHANGTDWVPNLAKRGFKTSNRPTVGAIMSFRAFSTGYGVYGHVALVVDVDPDGHGFTIAEANVLGLGLADVRWVPLNDPGIEGFVP